MKSLNDLFSEKSLSFQREKFGKQGLSAFKINAADLVKACGIVASCASPKYEILENVLIFARRNSISLIYFFRSLLEGELFLLKVNEQVSQGGLLKVSSISSLWPAAEAYERHYSELFGIEFQNLSKPLGSFLMDQERHPLREETVKNAN